MSFWKKLGRAIGITGKPKQWLPQLLIEYALTGHVELDTDSSLILTSGKLGQRILKRFRDAGIVEEVAAENTVIALKGLLDYIREEL